MLRRLLITKSMFKELSQILRKGDTLALTIALEGEGKMRVNIMPKLFTLDGENGEDRKALNHPVSIVGTIEELDSPAFVEQLHRFTGSVTELRNTLDEAEAAHKARAEEKKKPASKAPAPKPKPAEKSKPKAAEAEDQGETAPTEPAEPEEPEPTPLGI